jgi:conjugal transfer/type IV secretion protein DotA/TraY
MISFFALASQDQSVYYLSQLFGTVGTVLVPSAGNTTFNIMSIIFKSLNTTALIIGAIIVTHTTVMGLIKTAAEGEMLGKQWSSLWVPVRMVIGIASLFPTAAGYSVLQIIMMWVIVQGVGAADNLWTVVLNYVGKFGSPYSTVQLPTTVGIGQSMSTLFSNLVCEATLKGEDPQAKQPYTNTYTDQSGSHKFYYCADNPTNSFCTQDTVGQTIAAAAGSVAGGGGGATGTSTTSLSQALSGVSNCTANTTTKTIQCLFGPSTSPSSGACGSITFGDQSQVCPASTDFNSQMQCAGFTAQQAAIAWIVNVLYTTANSLVYTDNQYLQFSTVPTVTVPAQQPVQAPTFVASYCQENNIAPAACIGGNSMLPAATSTDNSSASDDLIKNILWPCYLESVVSGQPGGTCVKGTPGGNSVDFVGTSVTYYQNAVNSGLATAMMAYLSNSSNLASEKSGEWVQAQSTGWLLAGAYYYQIAKANGTTSTLSIPPLAVVAADLQGGNNNNPASNYRNNFSASTTLIAQIANQTQDVNSPTASLSGFSQVGGGMNAIAQGIWNLFSSAMTGGSGQVTNPLVSLASLGEGLMITAQVIFATTLAIMTGILGILGYGADPMALGTGSPTNGALEGAKFLFQSTYVAIAAFMGWCFTFGGMLGIYTPLIPFIIFTSGALGWFISVIEAMVAAPFVALGILSPSGHHELLGKADAGLMILFNTFMRPTLMIVGMMAAMILAPVAVSLVNSGFENVMTSIDSTPGLYELIVFITAYASLILTVMNKCFALIHIVPDRALTWIGGAAGSAGSDASDATNAAKSATGAAGEASASGAKGASDSVQGASTSSAKAMGNKEEKDTATAAKSEADSTSASRHKELMGKGGGGSKVE